MINLKFLKKDKTENKPKKLRNKAALKHGAFSIAFTAIVVAVAVGVNVLMAVLAERVNLEIDISLTGKNTLSEENVKFIKELDEKVTLYVYATKEDFANYCETTAEYEFSASDITGTEDNDGVFEYYNQTLNLLELYDVYSKNITLKFVDPYDPSSADLTNKFGELSFADIVVECEKTIGDEAYTKSEILHFDDIYQITIEDNMYSAYLGSMGTVTGNNIETALTSAIFRVISDNTPKVLVLEHHCIQNNLTAYLEFLEINNFTVDKHSDKLLTEIDPDIDLVIIAQPKEDFLSEELDIIDEWLANKEERGKGLLYFPDATGPDTPNLDAYLEEWGVAIEDGILYETNENLRHTSDATVFYSAPAAFAETDDVTKDFKDIVKNVGYTASGGNAVITQLYEEDGTRLTTPILTTLTDTVVIKPVSEPSDWKPDGTFDKNQHITMLMASETKYHENILRTSYVCVMASANMVDAAWLELPSNATVALNTAKLMSGAERGGITFTAKKVEGATFDTPVSFETARAVNIICQWVLPVALIILGIVVFVRRARR